jgi:ATP-binding cassette subfamily B (MDR/TAP) protein 1
MTLDYHQKGHTKKLLQEQVVDTSSIVFDSQTRPYLQMITPKNDASESNVETSAILLESTSQTNLAKSKCYDEDEEIPELQDERKRGSTIYPKRISLIGNNDFEMDDENNQLGGTKAKLGAIANGQDAALNISLRELYRFASSSDLALLFIGCIMSIANGGLYPCMALLFGDAISAFEPVNMDVIEHVSWTYLLIAFGLFVSDYIAHLCFHTTAERQIQMLQYRCFKHILHQHMGWFDQHENVLALSTQLTQDAIKIKDGMGSKLGELLKALAQFATGYSIGFANQWGISLVMISIMPFMAICLSWLLKTLRERSEWSQKKYAEAGSVAEETLASIRTVLSFNGIVKATQKFMKLSVGAEKENIHLARVVSIVLGIFYATIWITYCVGLWYGGKLVASGSTDPRTVFSAFYGILVGTISLAQISPNFSAVLSAKIAAANLFHILEDSSAIDASKKDEGLTPDTCQGAIEVINVSFAYPSRPDVRILDHYNASIKSGETIAFVGPSGGGKSTLVALLERFYDPVEGSILLDGVDIRTLQLHWLRAQIGLVSQEPVLFATSIYENILAGLTSISKQFTMEEQRKKIEQAAKLANIHEFILTLPDKYNTLVGEKGVMLSGGEKQRIAIARAIVRSPKILILDEATSALDTESEHAVQEALDELMEQKKGNMTTLVIAHRLSTISRADRILVIEEGRVVEEGNHEQLLQIYDGTYRALVLNQEKFDQNQKLQAAKIENYQQHHKRCKKEARVFLEYPHTSAAFETIDLDIIKEVEEEEDVSPRMTKSPSMTLRNQKVLSNKTSTSEDSNLGSQNESEEGQEAFFADFQMSRLIAMTHPERCYFILGMIAAVFNGLAFPVSAILFSSVVATMVKKYRLYIQSGYNVHLNDLYEDVRFYSLLYVAGAVLLVLINFVQSYSFKYMGEKVVTRLRELHFRALCRQSMGFFDDPKHESGALSYSLATYASQVMPLAGDLQGRILQAIVTFLAAILISFLMGSWLLSFLMSIVFPIMIFANIVRSHQMKGLNNSKEAESSGSKAGAIASEAVAQVKTIACFGLERKIAHRYYYHLQLPVHQAWKEAHIHGAALGFSSFATFGVYAIVFWFGGSLVRKGEVTFEELIRSLMAIMLSATGIGQVTSSLGDIENAKRAASRIFHLHDSITPINPFTEEGLLPDHVDGVLDFQNITFSYPTRPNVPILRNFSLRIEAGETVALCGPSGGGKSTLFALLERFYDPIQGEIFMDEVSISSLNINWLRGQIGLIGQEPVLFAGSILENIGFGKENGHYSPEEIEQAAQIANAHDFISAFPDGYHTEIGSNGGIQLSGGQKQRIAIARAILKDPKILLLDEATSALDTESERLVQNALDKMLSLKKRTTLFIAHRLSTIRKADRICILSGGTVAEQGTHQQLLDKDGIYASLVSRHNSNIRTSIIK